MDLLFKLILISTKIKCNSKMHVPVPIDIL